MPPRSSLALSSQPLVQYTTTDPEYWGMDGSRFPMVIKELRHVAEFKFYGYDRLKHVYVRNEYWQHKYGRMLST